MNWDDLKVVLAVARAGTLAGAARDLRVDATTVGRVLVGDLALPPLGPIAVFHLAQIIALWLVFVSIRGLAPHPA